jgi:small subunit ribosomal protein S8e
LKYALALSRGMKDHARSTRTRTGGRRRRSSDRKKHQLGSEPTETTVGERRLKTVDARGGTEKVRAMQTDTATVATDDGTVAATIENVAENPANPNYARRNIVTRGAVIETDAGQARVTSRPGQDGQVNAVLVE